MVAVSAYGDLYTKVFKIFPVGPKPVAIATADLNGDGLPDIITANPGDMFSPNDERPANDEISVLLSQGSMNYVPLPPLRGGFAPYGLAIANIDTMKPLDIVAVCFHETKGRNLMFFRNMGEGLFESTPFKVPTDPLPYNRMKVAADEPVFTKPGLTSVAVEDFNGDGYRDAITTGWSSDVLVYFPGAPTVYFGDPKFIRAPGGPRDVAVADFNGDGKKDLAVAMHVANEVALWKGDGLGGFEPWTRFSSRGRLPNRIRVADINRDGRLDILVSHAYMDDSIVIFYGDANQEFSVSQEILLGPDRGKLEHEIRDFVVTDMNEDGKLDIVAACPESRSVVILNNVSNGEQIPQSFSRESYSFKEGRPHAISVADFDQNGYKDIAVAMWECNAVTVLLQKEGQKKPEPKEAAGAKSDDNKKGGATGSAKKRRGSR